LIRETILMIGLHITATIRKPKNIMINSRDGWKRMFQPKEKKKNNTTRDNRDAPNTPSLHGKNTGVTHTPASAASSTVATPHARGQVEERDGKASPEPKSPEHVRTPRKPRSCTKCAEKRDELIKDKSFFEYLLTTNYWKKRGKRIEHRIHEIEEVL
jgi:hypothetical protein